MYMYVRRMDCEILWDILNFPNWESGAASFARLESDKAFDSGNSCVSQGLESGKAGSIWEFQNAPKYSESIVVFVSLPMVVEKSMSTPPSFCALMY